MRVAPALLLVSGLALTGCSKPKVVTQPELPALAAPTPPPRVVVPAEPGTVEPAPVTVQPADAAKRPARRPAPKPEPSKTELPKPVATPPVKEEPLPTLQATPPGDQAALERQTQALLAQAVRDLDRVKVKYPTLKADGKAQFDTAKRFVEQAQQALKEKNFAFALRLADKAATLASGLVSR